MTRPCAVAYPEIITMVSEISPVASDVETKEPRRAIPVNDIPKMMMRSNYGKLLFKVQNINTYLLQHLNVIGSPPRNGDSTTNISNEIIKSFTAAGRMSDWQRTMQTCQQLGKQSTYKKFLIQAALFNILVLRQSNIAGTYSKTSEPK